MSTNTPAVEATKLASNILSCISRGLGSTIILFLTAQYFKSKSNFRSAYYVILNMGYIADFVLFLNWVIPLDTTIYRFTLIMLEWYCLHFTTIWNAVLCLNRCSALVFLVKYERIWRPLTMFFIGIFMLAFPFIIDGYALLGSNCAMTNESLTNCLNFRKQYYLTGTIINAALNSVIIVLILLSMYKSSKDAYAASVQERAERRLIFQAIFSSFFQMSSFALKFASAVDPDRQKFYFFMYLSNCIWHVHHLAVMLSHFALSPTFKKAYMDFYFLTILLPKSIVSKHASTKVINQKTNTASSFISKTTVTHS